MRKTLFTITASLLGLASASAKDVYVYKAGVPNALCGVTNVQRIEFNENALSFVPKNESESKKINLADIDYLLFYNKEIVNSIRNASNSKEIFRLMEKAFLWKVQMLFQALKFTQRTALNMFHYRPSPSTQNFQQFRILLAFI